MICISIAERKINEPVITYRGVMAVTQTSNIGLFVHHLGYEKMPNDTSGGPFGIGSSLSWHTAR